MKPRIWIRRRMIGPSVAALSAMALCGRPAVGDGGRLSGGWCLTCPLPNSFQDNGRRFHHRPSSPKKCKAQVMPVTDTNVQLDLFEETCRPLGAHIWRKEPTGCYAEPTWVSQRLFEVEKFSGTVWDPACGLARIPEAARAAGYAAFASDLVDRGYR